MNHNDRNHHPIHLPPSTLLRALQARRWAHSRARYRRTIRLTWFLAIVAAALSAWSLWLLLG